MAWRVAKSLLILRAQVNAQWPTRRIDSDGTIGNAEHSSRTSDHNPNPQGVVDAMDLTHDPVHGFNSYAFAQALLDTRDPRIKYIISKGRIASGDAGPKPWVWRNYTGSNPHDHHCHVSVKAATKFADDETPWRYDVDHIEKVALVDPKPYTPPPPTLRVGSIGVGVRKLQIALGVKVDGQFGDATRDAVRAAQTKAKIHVDGIVGPMTYKALGLLS